MNISKTEVLGLLGVIAAVALFALTLSLAQHNKEARAAKECEAFNQTTGYWVKFDPKNGCFVLIDNQYLVEKSLLGPNARPAFDPKIVGIEAVIKQDMENNP